MAESFDATQTQFTLFAIVATLAIFAAGLWMGLGWYSLAFAAINALADYAIWVTK